MGKGSSPRKRQVSWQENSDNWERTYGKKLSAEEVDRHVKDLLGAMASLPIVQCQCPECDPEGYEYATDSSERETGSEDAGSEVRRMPAEGSDPLPQ